jgi:PPOX class probable F420-dependent enzyme
MDDADAMPLATRPYMPGYGILPAEDGPGLLPWSWALERLQSSHEYWLATTWPDGGPHVMPVWGVWRDGALWFSSGLGSRKARNLENDPQCVLTTDNPREPVVVEGEAERVLELEEIAAFNDTVNEKYGTHSSADFYDPATNGVWRVTPTWVFGLASDDFTGTPTRWEPS